MELLIRFDAYLIALTEKFCHWFQTMTGKTNFFLAKMTTYLITVCLVIELLLELNKKKGLTVTMVIDSMLLLSMIGFQAWQYSLMEYYSLRRLVAGYSNPHKIRLRNFRIFIAVTLVLPPPFLVFSYEKIPPILIHWSLFLFCYFVSCDPLQPCSGKVQDWLMRTFGKPVQDSNQSPHVP